MTCCVYETPFLTLDQPTADLILQLQLEDAELYFSSSKGKGRGDDISDEAYAFELQRQEIEAMPLFCTDNRMARSMASAVVNDGPIISEAFIQEEIAARDHDIAQKLSLGIATPNTQEPQPDTEAGALDDEILEKLRMLYVSKNFDDIVQDDDAASSDTQSVAGDRPESSAWAASRPSKRAPNARRCEACRDEVRFVDIARVPCQHEYCRGCLGELFEASMTDETLFPPRCCRKPIPVNSVRIFLKTAVVREFAKKKIEFETPNRTYCHSPTCSAFIHPRNIISDVAICDECKLRTCTNCKTLAHTGDCPNDTALQQTLEIARENGWQRCHSCWRVVELDHGCNHMICRCGAQFCYVCGQPWKTCSCQQWDEHRLYARANVIIDRQQGPDAAAVHPPEPVPAPLAVPAPVLAVDEPEEEEVPPENPHRLRGDPVVYNRAIERLRLLQVTMQNLRDNHECGHRQWRWINGAHRCEECSHFLPQYIFECRQCQLRACNRCRRNRL